MAAYVTYYLSREAKNEYCRKRRVTKYFDKIEDKEVVIHGMRDTNDDFLMDGHKNDGKW
jgi:hypothetical protein